MRTRRLSGAAMILLGTMAALGCITTVRTQAIPPPVVVQPYGGENEPFYDDLSPYGEWVHVSGPGWVWSPYAVPASWQPYRAGTWVLTDYGWTWASDEEFGWVVYHYGRWHVDARYGWVWVPGTEWGPAWVAWQEGGGWVGWAPLPWQVSWHAGVGLDWGGVDVHVALGPSSWCFVPARHVIDPRLSTYIVPAQRNVTLIRNTVHVTNYTFINQRIVNQSLKPGAIGRAVGRPIHRYPLEPADAPDAPRGGKVRGGKFVVYRPDVERGPRGVAPPERIESEPPARAPRGHQQRLNRPSRPQPYPAQSPARPYEEPRETDPNAPPGQTKEEHDRGRPDRPEPARRHGPRVAPPPPAPPAPPDAPAAPVARENKPDESRKAAPGRARSGSGEDPAPKRGKPKQEKSKPGPADCDKEKGNCPEAKQD